MHAIGDDLAAAHNASSLNFRLFVFRRLARRDVAHHAGDVLALNLGRLQSSNQRNDVILKIAQVLCESRGLLVGARIFLEIARAEFGDGRDGSLVGSRQGGVFP